MAIRVVVPSLLPYRPALMKFLIGAVIVWRRVLFERQLAGLADVRLRIVIRAVVTPPFSYPLIGVVCAFVRALRRVVLVP